MPSPLLLIPQHIFAFFQAGYELTQRQHMSAEFTGSDHQLVDQLMFAHDHILRQLKTATPSATEGIDTATATLVSYSLLRGQLSHTLVLANGIIDAVLNYQHDLEGAGFWRVSTIHSMGKWKLNSLWGQILNSGRAHDTGSEFPAHAVLSVSSNLQLDLLGTVGNDTLNNSQITATDLGSDCLAYNNRCVMTEIFTHENRITFTLYDNESEVLRQELDKVEGPFSAIEVCLPFRFAYFVCHV